MLEFLPLRCGSLPQWNYLNLSQFFAVAETLGIDDFISTWFQACFIFASAFSWIPENCLVRPCLLILFCLFYLCVLSSGCGGVFCVLRAFQTKHFRACHTGAWLQAQTAAFSAILLYLLGTCFVTSRPWWISGELSWCHAGKRLTSAAYHYSLSESAAKVSCLLCSPTFSMAPVNPVTYTLCVQCPVLSLVRLFHCEPNDCDIIWSTDRFLEPRNICAKRWLFSSFLIWYVCVRAIT